MGGLISVYAGLMFPEVYSKFMIFSFAVGFGLLIYREPMRFSAFDSPRKYTCTAAAEKAPACCPILNGSKNRYEKSSHGKSQFASKPIRTVGTMKRCREEFPKAANGSSNLKFPSHRLPSTI
ncbi:MAG: hypothetical protein IPK76_07230 [Lewinellaceae bacterium]|nr:hypothetical protein [Lewinellaceae bacterium]